MSIVVDVNVVSDSDMIARDVNLGGSSSTSPQDDNIYERLKKAAQDDNIYERQYRKTLRVQTHFAMELMTLKPSLASKLNVSGFSPIHLALLNNHIRMVRGLVSIKGRGRITPLHHVAGIGDAELLNEFLLACPIEIWNSMILLREA
ncbi:unnamed protein product, partial [Thlaspi arvense]